MIYLDYQSTTPLAPEARAAMLPWLAADGFANPHSPHKPGRAAAAAVEAARTRIMAADPVLAGGRLVFTSGATEAINWALKSGYAGTSRRRVVTVATEHACTLDSVRWLAGTGAETVILPVRPDGRIAIDSALAAIDDDTAMVAVMLVNNEIGTIQPVAALAARARAVGALLLCDAVQGFGRVPLPPADLIALSAHKIHGPKGIGALWMRDGVTLAPFLHGGGQEGGVRAGTLSPMLCAGFGAAVAVAAARQDADAAHVTRLAARLRAALPGWTVNGSIEHRYPGNLSLRRAGVDAARLISELRDIAFSAGSACASGSGRPSHVLRAIGLDDAQARSTIRIGFGRDSTDAEIDHAAAAITAAADRMTAS